MIGYSSTIRILTGGESCFSLEFHGYQDVPDNIIQTMANHIYYGVCRIKNQNEKRLVVV